MSPLNAILALIVWGVSIYVGRKYGFKTGCLCFILCILAISVLLPVLAVLIAMLYS